MMLISIMMLARQQHAAAVLYGVQAVRGRPWLLMVLHGQEAQLHARQCLVDHSSWGCVQLNLVRRLGLGGVGPVEGFQLAGHCTLPHWMHQCG
jgi:hypothetical protein